MKAIKVLVLLGLVILAPPLHGGVLLLQSGFSDGSIRSTTPQLTVQHASGIQFPGVLRGDDLMVAAGLYGFRLNEFYPTVEEFEGSVVRPTPDVLVMLPPFPNPAEKFSLKFYLPHSEAVEIAIYSVTGARVKTLLRRKLQPGWHTLQWDGTDDMSREVGAGIYFCQLRTSKKTLTHKLILVK